MGRHKIVVPEFNKASVVGAPLAPALPSPVSAPGPGDFATAEAARRELNRQRSKAWRDAKKAQLDPGAQAAKLAAEATQNAQAKAAADLAMKAAVEARTKMESQLSGVLTNAFEGAADIIQTMALDGSRPHLGRERAEILGAVWAPVMLPYVEQYLKANPSTIVAMVATIAAFGGWAAEYHSGKPANPRPASDHGFQPIVATTTGAYA